MSIASQVSANSKKVRERRRSFAIPSLILVLTCAALTSCGGGDGIANPNGGGGNPGGGNPGGGNGGPPTWTSPVGISAFTASPSQVSYGETTTLSWTLNGIASSLTLDGISVLGESSRVVTPARRQTYLLAASNPLGGETRSVTVAARGLDLLAGDLGGKGSVDGTGAAARFMYPWALAADGSGNVYVADTGNNTVRKITADGRVSTLAGLAGVSGSADGTGSTARFNSPGGIAVDGSDVYVADTGNHTIRHITASGAVVTLAGSAGMSGSTDATGSAARFYFPHGLAIDGSGKLYVSEIGNQTIRKVTLAGVVTTLAGSPGMIGSTDGTGSAARFNYPFGVAADSSGNIYVADTNNSTIRKVTSAGAVTTLAGSPQVTGSADGAGSTARFNFPNGVAVDGSGNLFVADQANGTLRKVTSAGVVSTLAGSPDESGSADGMGNAARFLLPSGVAADGSGKVYVADTWNQTIRKVSAANASVTTLAGSVAQTGSADGTGSAARFSSPIGVAVDGSGNAYVADTNNNTIRKITSAGMVSTLAGSPGMFGGTDASGSSARFQYPSGVAVDGSGNVYVADTRNHTVRKVTPAGMVSTLAGSPGMFGSTDASGSSARFRSPAGVAVDGSGNVYVADTSNHTLRKITPAGVVSTLAGSAGMPGSADGSGSSARFYWPSGVAVDGSGNIYVADTWNHLVRKVTAAGVVSTLAGSAGTIGSADGSGSAARFNFPAGVTTDDFGNVYVADTSNHILRKITADGAVTTIAGSTSVIGAIPGRLPGSMLLPQAIALTPSGDAIVTSSQGVVQITAF